VSAQRAGAAGEAIQSLAWEPLHASALVVGEAGVLVRGPSGSGKSALILALIALARDRRLFAALIGDDRVLVAARSGRLLARGAPEIRGLIERRGFGVVTADAEPCAALRLVVDLLPEPERVARLPDAAALGVSLGGIALPRLSFDARSATIERAHATLGYVDRTDDKNMTGIVHFA
jgi:HPr kinase/phosphorylase